MQITGYFPTPILTHKVSDELADAIEQHVVKKVDRLNFKEHQHNDYNDDKIVDLINDLPDLYDEILYCREEFEKETEIRSNTDIDYWIQDYRSETAFHELHHHGVYGISGVYWVRANNDAGPISFKNPVTMSHYADVPSQNNSFFSNRFLEFQPKKGFVLLFPSWLEHEVLKGNSRIIRTTIAFNFGQKGIKQDV